ncbi:MAG: DoxX family protein [Herminiimonas sp.]|nr:DoxX family protein [Herminiimonas sp.]
MEKLLRLHQGMRRYDLRIADWGGSVLSLALRIYVGWQFFKAGLTKIADWSSTVALFRDEYQVPVLPPETAALMGTAGELALPVLLALGLLSRPAALGLFVLNVTAVLSYPQLFMFDCPAALNDHFYWGILLIVIMVSGPGRVAFDHWLDARASRLVLDA